MAETIVNGKWHWHQLPIDLKKQANYKGVNIDPFSIRPASCAGSTAKGNRFTVTWVPEQLMMISLLKDELALIKAFAVVVEYRPFCKYRYKPTGLITYEWDKKDPKGRFAELQQGSEVDELELLS